MLIKKELRKRCWQLGADLKLASQGKHFNTSSVPREWLRACRELDDFERRQVEQKDAVEREVALQDAIEQSSSFAIRLEAAGGFMVLQHRVGTTTSVVIDLDFNPEHDRVINEDSSVINRTAWVYAYPLLGMTEMSIAEVQQSQVFYDKLDRDEVMRDYLNWKLENKGVFRKQLKELRIQRAKSEEPPATNEAVSNPLLEAEAKTTLKFLGGIGTRYNLEIHTAYVEEESTCFLRYRDVFLSVAPSQHSYGYTWKIIPFFATSTNQNPCEINEVFTFPIRNHTDDIELGTGLMAFLANQFFILRPYWRMGPITVNVDPTVNPMRVSDNVLRTAEELSRYGFSVKVSRTTYENGRPSHCIEFSDFGLESFRIDPYWEHFYLEKCECRAYDEDSGYHELERWPISDMELPDIVIDTLIFEAGGNPLSVRNSPNKVVVLVDEYPVSDCQLHGPPISRPVSSE